MLNRHKFLTIFSILILLLIGDYWLREVALKAVVADVRRELQDTDFIAEHFDPDYASAEVYDVQDFVRIDFVDQTLEKTFKAALDFMANYSPIQTTLLASEIAHSEWLYYAYKTEICGNTVCPFDTDRIVKVPEDYYETYRAGQKISEYVPTRWGLIYKFDIKYWIRQNFNGEVVEAGVDVVDYPRNPFDVWGRQLLNSISPYGNSNYVYRKYLPLGAEVYLD